MEVKSIIDNITNKSYPDNVYKGDDGLLHCGVCFDRIQAIVNFPWGEEVVPCICSCTINKRKEEEEQRHRERIEDNRRECFGISRLIKCTFEDDDQSDTKISDAMLKYAENFKDFFGNGQGLLLHGPIGTGKTFYAAAIANAVIDKGYKALVTSLSRIANEIQASFESKQEIIDDLQRYALVIFDDLGIERSSEYMREIVYSVIDARYKTRLPFIITTNETLDCIKNPKDISYTRIYDRILERCFPIAVEGGSRRRKIVRNTYFDTKKILGL